MNKQPQASADAGMDHNGLYREEIFTDRRIGSIHVMTPVLATGEEDSSRDTLYLGETQIHTAAGALPISFEIEATNIGEAAKQFSTLAEQASEEAIKQIEEMQREQANKIVIPGQENINPMAGMTGGGKIQIP